MAARNNHSDVVEYLLEQVSKKMQCSLFRERPKIMLVVKCQTEQFASFIVLKKFCATFLTPFLCVALLCFAVRIIFKTKLILYDVLGCFS